MYYVSTRDHSLQYTPAQAIAQGLSRDGGLFLPVSIPKLPEGALKEMTGMTYQQRAQYIMSLYLEDFTAEELGQFAEKAYGPDKFDTPAVAPLKKMDDGHLLPGAVARPHLRLQGHGAADAALPAHRFPEEESGGKDGVYPGSHLRRHRQGCPGRV